MKELNEKKLGPEPKDTPSTESVGNSPKWEDLTFPCNILIKEKDIFDVTNNKPEQTIADAATQDGTFLRTFRFGWIRTTEWELVEVLPMPVEPTTKTEP